jgi:hypothetical protein
MLRGDSGAGNCGQGRAARLLRAGGRGSAGRRAQTGTALAGVAALAAALSACSAIGAGTGGASTPSAVVTATVAAPTTTGVPGGAPSSAPALPTTVAVPTLAGGVPICNSSVLSAAVVGAQGAAGTQYVEMSLTNNSSARCAVRGYPGISLLDAANNELGAPADREPAGEPPGAAGANGGTVVLAHGGLAVFTVLMTTPGILPGCDTQASMAKAFTIRVYPPDNTVPLLVGLNGANGELACADPTVHQLKVTTLGAV